MKAIRIYDWSDKGRERPLKEVPVLTTQNLTRNGIKRVYVWTKDDTGFNYTLYPDAGTAYPEYDERLQKQRIDTVYLYDVVD
jgi:hypothetical protein